jgi:hypothetical protein
VLAAAAAVTSATVLRAAGRIYLGWGAPDDPFLTVREPDEPREGEPTKGVALGLRTRTLLLTPALLLVAIGFAVAFLPGITGGALAAATSAEDFTATEALVLHDKPVPAPHVQAYAPSRSAVAYGCASGVGAVALAGLALWWPRRGRWLGRQVLVAVRGLKAVHDGSVGDYAVWFTAGAGVIAAVWALTLV